MKHIKHLLAQALVLSTLCLLVACSGSKGFSLKKSTATMAMDECTALIKKKKYDKGIKCLEAYKSRHYGQPGAADAELAVADAYFNKKDYFVAAESYQIFIESYPYNENISYAYYKAGLSYLKDGPKAIDRDQAYLDLAIQYLGTVVKYYSASPYEKVAREYYDVARLKQARRSYYIGRFYFKTNEYLAAIPRFQEIVTEFPKLGLDEKSFYYLILSLQRTNQKEVAQKYIEVFKNYYPESKYAKKVK